MPTCSWPGFWSRLDFLAKASSTARNFRKADQPDITEPWAFISTNQRKIFISPPWRGTATWWIWSQEPRNDARAPFAIATHPDVIVFGGWNWSEHNADVSEDWVKPNLATLNSVPLNDAFHIILYAEAHGYRETHRFCGHVFLRSGYSGARCQVALEPVPGSVPSTPEVQSCLALTAVPLSRR
jgi:hypothetical protein